MPNAAFIAGDWGTTHLRLYLCDRHGEVLERKAGKGVSGAHDKIGSAFSSLVEGWDGGHGKLPAILCGMVGSTMGWHEVPYIVCPARLDSMAANSFRFDFGGRAIAIAPGLTCQNRLQAPDMMRGEETQLLGALRCDPGLAAGRQFLCLPGTHTKWVSLKDGVVEQFQTGLAGELFEILRSHSILVNGDGMADVTGGAAFARALAQTRKFPDAELIHLLFEVRSRQLRGELNREDAAAHLSGLIIGQDVSGAKRLFRAELPEAQRITVIGAPRLSQLYAQALGAHGFATRQIDGEIASLGGLAMLHDMLFDGGAGRAA